MITDTDLVPAVTDETFARDVLAAPGPVLVDFWAQWCPPCHMIAPVLAAIARERAGTLAVRSMDYDANPVTGARYRVLSLPTLLLFVGGEPIGSVVGAQPKARLLARIDDALTR
ncbi:thioredoxin family protein [Nakamurella sp.]|uniref:thioredoxin family protein n=1 Tax=Nakamurella sp. TaxID=1869182 RepID=UPI003B3A9B37